MAPDTREKEVNPLAPPQMGMVRFNWLDQHLPDEEDQREYAREKCVEAVAATLDHAMVWSDLNRSALAERLGKSKSQVSRMLSGVHNMTLRTLGDLLWACRLEVVDFDQAVGPLGAIDVPSEDGFLWNVVGGATPTGLSPPPEAVPVGAALAGRTTAVQAMQLQD